MSVFVAPSSCKSLLVSGKPWNHKAVVLPPRLQCGFTFSCQTKPKPLMIIAQMANPSTYSSRISTDVPLYELPGEEWRINMLPIDFLFQTVKPVIDMRVRCKSQGVEYPPEVPNDITKVVELEIIRWELQGLDDVLKPSHFSLGVKGILYPDRRGPRTRLTGTLQINMSFILPAALSLIPEEVRREVAESVLRRLMENMKSKVNGSLLADYSSFKREKSIR
ncbi:uncharacterized protein [Coffea arabica]|uniref:Uncharacterized protein isoform X3 n=1 Tax=Coffea arabica TaxID=13443 RepID=A0ABM4UZ77_COFAR